MNVVITAAQFTISCLALGLGMFLAAEAIRGISRMRMAPTAGTRAVEAMGGTALLMAGAYGALLAVPM